MDKIETLLFVSFNYFILNASLIFFIKIILYRDVYLLLLFLKWFVFEIVRRYQRKKYILIRKIQMKNF